ncbi:MAG: diguanylate cyclase [Anaerolineales bacterium]|nr:diguanylate cyclase [Anaerolineales bacterium]
MINLYVALIYLCAAIPYAWLGLYAWRKRPAVAVIPFAWSMLAISFWAFTYSLEIFSLDLQTKLSVVNIEYIGIVSLPVCLTFFALEFTGKSHLLTTRTKFLLWSLPLATLVLVWTNNFHHLMWDMETISTVGGLVLLDVQFRPFFWIHVLYSYILVTYASILLVIELMQRPSIYRIQISFILLGMIVPAIGSLIFAAGVNPIKNLDPTPLFFLPTALGLSWAISKYRLLEVLPPEHLTVLKTMKDGVIVLNPQQRISYINPIAGLLLNCTENEALGQPLAHISGQYAEKLSPYLIAGVENRAEITVQEGNQAKVFELTVSPVSALENSKKQIQVIPDIMIILHDITTRKEVEVARARRESIMSAISLTAEQFLKESSWEHNVPAVLDTIGQAAHVSHVYVVMNYRGADDAIHSSLCYEWADPRVPSQIKNPLLQHVPLRKAGLERWENYLSRGLPLFGVTSDFPQEEQELLKHLGSLAVAVAPIYVDSQWWGFIMFDDCFTERVWNSVELEALQTTANIFGSAESRARAEQKLLRRQYALNLLHELVSISLKSRDIKDMAQIVVERLGALIRADGCFLTLWDDVNQRTIPLAAYGPFAETYSKIEVKPSERTFTETALSHGTTLVIEDTQSTAYADQRLISQFPSRSVLVLPLIAKQKKLGGILIAFNTLHAFQLEEIQICEQAADLIALALEKFNAVEQAQRRAETSESLRKASVAVTEMRDLDEAVNQILEQLLQVVPYDSASVQILEGNELHIIGGHGWNNMADVIGLRFPVPGDNPNSVVIETGKPYCLPETWKIYKKFNEPPHDHIRSWLGVPLIFQEKTIGLLAIDSSEPNDFSDDDIEVAAEFANQVAVVLENARLFKETQTQAITDALTGIYNRRGLLQLGEFELLRARRIERPFCAMIFDIDHFKRVNDHYGHKIGDQVLHSLAERCKKTLRSIDLIGRYGGEEFVILLPETNLESARRVAERLRQFIMNEPFPTDAGALRITVSIGLAEAKDTDSLHTLIEHADVALYKAKEAGRNRVMLDELT